MFATKNTYINQFSFAISVTIIICQEQDLELLILLNKRIMHTLISTGNTF